MRVLAPVLPLEHLVELEAIKPGAVEDLRAYDPLVKLSLLFVPTIPDDGLPESLALLYAAITVHHGYLEGRRIAQLSVPAAVHLKRQLAMHVSGTRFDHDEFNDS